MSNSSPLMRPLFALGLLVGGFLLSECNSPSAETSATPAPVRERVVSSNSAVTTVMAPGPDPAQRSVRPEDVLSQDTIYAATLPVLDDEDGAIRLRVVVNPKAHTLEKTTALFVPRKGAVSYKQIGNGVGQYDAKTGRYYFNVGYQKVRKLGAGLTDYGNIKEISGWVQPGTSQAAAVSKEPE